MTPQRLRPRFRKPTKKILGYKDTKILGVIKSFTDLVAWKEAHILTLLVYKATSTFPSSEIFGLTSQVRRAVVSIESCIAEGFARYHYKDRINFYYDARGSVSEVESQLITSKDLNYLGKLEFRKIYNQAEKVGIILSGLIKSTGRLSDGR